MIAFVLGGPIGRIMTQALTKFMKHNPPYFDQINGSRNYPYFYMFKHKIIAAFNKNKALIKKDYVPSVPLVYLYAQKKPFQFHGAKWMNYLK